MKATYVTPAIEIVSCEEVIRTSGALPWNDKWPGGWDDNYENTNPIG